MKYLWFFCCLLTAGVSAQTHPTALTPQELPDQVARVVALSTQLVENQIHSQLDGKTSGFLVIDLQIETRNSFLVYADKLDFWTAEDPLYTPPRAWKVEVIQRPRITRFLDPVSKKLKEGYRGQSVFRLKLSLPETLLKAPPVSHQLQLVSYFQACSDQLCLLPVAVTLPIALSSAPSTKPRGMMSWAEGWGARLKEWLQADNSSLSFSVLGLVFLAGLITAFTPCVYPLYPVTLGMFARWSQSPTGLPAFLLSLLYALGLTVSYAVLGLLSGVSGVVFGAWTQTPFFLLGVGGLILLSAIFFSGWLTFPMPQFLVRYFTKVESPQSLGKRSAWSQVAQAFFMGTGLGVVASPCVGPVLVVLLTWLGSSHAGWSQGFLLLALFGAGMSLPFLILGHLIVKMGRRPSLGKYTPYIKNLGTLLLTLAAFFFLVPGFQLLLARQHLSNNSVTVKYPVYNLDNWSRKQWTILDFRADWCTACLELEHETFSSPRVSPLFESGNWEMVRVDMTASSETQMALAKKFGVVSLPSVLIVSPQGNFCKSSHLYGFESPAAFLERLQEARESCR